MKYRYDLLCVRGYAIIFVYLYHKYKNTFSGGFLGVDIFFILSGFFSTSSLVNIINKNLTILSYNCKRIRRLKFVEDLSLIYIYIISENFYILWKRSKDILASELYVSNYYFYYISINYLEQSNSIGISPALHFWSLSIEFQFYIYSSIVVKYIINSINAYILTAFLVANYIYVIIISKYNESFVYFSFGNRLIEFLSGILINIKKIDNNFYLPYYLYDLLSILLWIVTMKICSISIYPNYTVVLPVFYVYFIISQNRKNDSKILSLFVIQFIGKISYSFYAIHYPLLIKYNRITFMEILIVSVVIYYLIETTFSNNIKTDYTTILYFNLSIVFFFYLHKIASQKLNRMNVIQCKCAYNFKMSIYFAKCNLHINNDYFLYYGDSHLLQWIPTLFNEINKLKMYTIFLAAWIVQYDRFQYLSILFKKIGYPRYVLQCLSTNFNLSNNCKIEYTKFVLTLSSKVDKYIIIKDNPRLDFNPNFFYIKSMSKLNCMNKLNCTFGNDIIFLSKNIYFVKSNYLCEEDICPYYYYNKKLYSDCNHLTTCMIEIIKHEIVVRIQQILSINQKQTNYSKKIPFCILYSKGDFSLFKKNILKIK